MREQRQSSIHRTIRKFDSQQIKKQSVVDSEKKSRIRKQDSKKEKTLRRERRLDNPDSPVWTSICVGSDLRRFD
jgi:hypothetical protein